MIDISDLNRYIASVRRDLLTEKIAEFGVWDKQ